MQNRATPILLRSSLQRTSHGPGLGGGARRGWSGSSRPDVGFCWPLSLLGPENKMSQGLNDKSHHKLINVLSLCLRIRRPHRIGKLEYSCASHISDPISHMLTLISHISYKGGSLRRGLLCLQTSRSKSCFKPLCHTYFTHRIHYTTLNETSNPLC